VAWGSNSRSQANVPDYVRGVRAVAEGDGFSVALKADGTITGWGDDSDYQLETPCATFTGGVCWTHESGFTAIAAGGHHTVALRYDGTVRAWGSDEQHQTDVPRDALHVIAVAAGSSFSLALVQQFAPNAPTSVTVSAGNQGAIVSWQAPKGDGGVAITGYKVVASPGGKTCQTTTARSCVVAPLANGTSYTFTVVAINPVGAGTASTASAAVVPAAIGPVLTPAPTPRPADTANGSGPLATGLAAVLAVIGLISLAFAFAPGLGRVWRARAGMVPATAGAAAGSGGPAGPAAEAGPVASSAPEISGKPATIADARPPAKRESARRSGPGPGDAGDSPGTDE
jgi:hypothetical protein